MAFFIPRLAVPNPVKPVRATAILQHIRKTSPCYGIASDISKIQSIIE
jgi:hypothetical protein